MDIDITHDIRASAPGPAGGADDEALPPARSRKQRRTKVIRNRLASRVREQAPPTVKAGIAREGHTARVRAEGERLHVGYDPSFGDSGFVRPEVLVDSGARLTSKPGTIGWDAAASLPDPSLPKAHPADKPANAPSGKRQHPCMSLHVFHLRQQDRGNLPSKHRHDAIRLDDLGIADKALSDHARVLAVARHKAMFLREKETDGAWIDYEAAVSDKLRPVPTGPVIDTLAEGYAGMQADGLLPDDGEPFETLNKRCADIGARADRPRTGDGSVD